MKGNLKREDDYLERRKHLENLTEPQLEERFWELVNQITEPMIELAKKDTTPSIERSVLLRMGFSSIETQSIVKGVIDRGLMGKGAGHVVYKLAKEKNMGIREAGLKLINAEMWEEVEKMFAGGER